MASMGTTMLYGGWGDDILRGGAGDDDIEPGGGDDIVKGGSGNRNSVDYYFAPSGVVVDLKAGTASGFGNDTVAGIQDVEGTTHDDIIIGNGADNFLQGYDGNDTIRGRSGDDWLHGCEGNDRLYGGTATTTSMAGRHRHPQRRPRQRRMHKG